MTVTDAMALLRCADAEFLSAAGPAVLRLKLLEVTHLAQNRRLTGEMREAARVAAIELRQLIAERPCVSLVDHAAKNDIANARRAAAPLACRISAPGHA
ncbi:hypothetical protein [Methylocystis sp. ATCC 49242]|uniref:hypothetical protein n=1 Tax=Methylocystis sp. ATCC 49242 TaxID=622637 RepID=UPI0001F8884A|nr:hypothetical protein [Methylocystis sp. ATCC 49242]